MPSFAFKGALVAVVMVFTYSALLPSLRVQAVDGVESSYFPTVAEVSFTVTVVIFGAFSCSHIRRVFSRFACDYVVQTARTSKHATCKKTKLTHFRARNCAGLF